MNEPVDLAAGLRPPWQDWGVMITVGALLAIAVASLLPDSGIILVGLVVVVALYAVSWMRGRRMQRGLDAVDRDARHGRLSLVVRVKSGSFVQFIGSGRDGVLTIEDGTVRLQGTSDEAWPASTIRIGRRPNWFANRGIQLITPTGARWISSVRTTDPAIYVSAWLDGRAVTAMDRALATNASVPPPGWYPDPTGSPTWRWWDGVQWGATSDAPPPTPGPSPI